jgi:methyl-accepting chemotaxis protein
VALGDLTNTIITSAKDETKEIVDLLNVMISKLQDTVRNIGFSSSQLSSSANQLSTTTMTVSSNIEAQQIQTEQIATAMKQMTLTVDEIAANAESLAAEASHVEQQTISGSAIINNTINSIDSISEGVAEAAVAVSQLQASSTEIGSILNVIKGVAEQTNLLALNAAIEAARAGEHGRGFAVVADEVRTLATRTQESAEQIQGMVTTLQSDTQHATAVMESQRVKAEEMSSSTQEAKHSMSQIVSAMSRISDMSAQVATAAEEQSCVSNEINKNVYFVSNLSSENKASTQEVSKASMHLAQLADALDIIVRKFKVQ